MKNSQLRKLAEMIIINILNYIICLTITAFQSHSTEGKVAIWAVDSFN